jgi:TRAP-type mannitol/chloroaromatic compound transport system permease small subunit
MPALPREGAAGRQVSKENKSCRETPGAGSAFAGDRDRGAAREEDLRALLGISNTIDSILEFIAKVMGWCFLLMMIVICFDVVSRKFGYQLELFGIDLGSTRLQEGEWHLHSFLFLSWIAFCYVRNAHVRIDVFTGGMSQRGQSWLELFGCIVFALPYVLVALPYAFDFFHDAYRQNEASAAPNGLPARYVVKFFLFFGFASMLAAVISVFIRRFVFLFGTAEDAQAAMPQAPKSAH